MPRRQEQETKPFDWTLLLVLLAVLGSAWLSSELKSKSNSSSNNPTLLSNNELNNQQGYEDLGGYDPSGVLTIELFGSTWKCARMNNPLTSWDSSNPNAPSPTFIDWLPVASTGSEVLMLNGVGEDGVGNPPFLEIKGQEKRIVESLNDTLVWSYQANGTKVCDQAVGGQ